jgi:Flp pilus assembly protein TadD
VSRRASHRPASKSKPDDPAVRALQREPAAHDWRLLLAVFAAAAAIRLLIGWQLLQIPLVRTPRLDSAEYLQWARRLAGGDFSWPIISAHAPGYPLLLAAILKASGESLGAVVTVQAIIGAVTATLIALLGTRLFDRTSGLVAGILYATYGPAVYIDTAILAEGTLLFLLTSALVVLADRPLTPWRGLAAGVLFGAATIVRPTALLTMGAIFVWLLLRDRRAVLTTIGVMVLGATIVAAPVLAKNRSTSHSLSMQGFGGMNFYIGNSPTHSGKPTYRLGAGWDALQSEASRAGIADPAGWDDYYVGKTTAEIRRQPTGFLRLLLAKSVWAVQSEEVRDTHSYYFFTSQSALLRMLPRLSMLFPLACAGLVLSIWRRRTPWLLVSCTIAAILNVTLLVVGLRYRMPIVPALAVLAGFDVSELALAARSRERRTLAIGVSALVAAVLLSNVRTDAASHDLSEEWAFTCSSLITEHSLSEAEQTCRRALGIDENSGLAWDMLGLVLYNQRDLPEARRAFERALSIDAAAPRPLHHLGLVDEQDGRLETASERYRRALVLDPFNLEIRKALGRSLVLLEKPAEAVPVLAVLAEQSPHDGDAHLLYANALGRAGRLRDARTEIIGALEIAPRNADAWLDLCLVSLGLGELDGPLGAAAALTNARTWGGGSPERIAFAADALARARSKAATPAASPGLPR